MSNISTSKFQSDTEDEDYVLDETQVEGLSEEEDEDLPVVEEAVVDLESPESRKARIQDLVEQVKQPETLKRKMPISEIYKQSLQKKTTTFKFAGEQYTTQVTADDDIFKKPKEQQPVLKDQKRRSKLEALAIKFGVSDAVRLSTLEKSKLDWNKFVEEEGIKDELKRKNKDGYLERVAFLQRVDSRLDDQYLSNKHHQ